MRGTHGALLLGLAVLSVSAAPASADVRDGVDAWSRGAYGPAVAAWRPAATAGDADAQFNLAQAYLLGRGVPRDMPTAAEWFRRAALQDHAAAQAKFGLLLFDQGKRAEATPWLEKAVAHHEPRAQLVLGTMLYNGDGVARDWPRAYALLVRAAAADVPRASEVQAQMDKVIPIAERQQGLLLARDDEAAAKRPQLSIAPPPPAPVRVALASAVAPPSVARMQPARKPTQPPPAPVVASRGSWRLQLGAFGDAANARRLWTQTAASFPGANVSYVKAGVMTRVLIGPYPSRASASQACRAIRPCIAVNS